MSKVFTSKGLNSPEEYLKAMLSCVGEDGEIAIARDSLDQIAFVTVEEESGASFIEKAHLDKSKIAYPDVLAFYNRVLASLSNASFPSEFAQLEKEGKFGERVAMFAGRLGRMLELKAPAVILDNERCMLIDSIVLYLGSRA